MLELLGRRLFAVTAVLAVLVLSACASSRVNRAPVEDRTGSVSSTSKVTVPVETPVKPPQGFENAGKPGYYTVKPGDTLIRIALDSGQSAQDIARWSQVQNPNLIEVGQVLRVEPPAGETAVVVRPISSPVVVARPMNAPKALAAQGNAPPAGVEQAADAKNPVTWMWPADGKVIAGFDEVKNKGLDIAGEAGSPVLAVSDGRVVYVGSGLRGYGNLIILKHDNVFLTAYAHNQTLLVKEDQMVTKGQKIAEMGNSDADSVKLHFEVRRQGKPVDPTKYLPAR